MMCAPNRSAMRASTGECGVCNPRAISSASTITAPRAASIEETVDFPEPMPPVKPTSSTAASALRRAGVVACGDRRWGSLRSTALGNAGIGVLELGPRRLDLVAARGPVALGVDLEVLAVLGSELATL